MARALVERKRAQALKGGLVKHTPGPWAIGRKSEYGTRNPSTITHNPSIITTTDDDICQVYGIPLHTNLEKLGPQWEQGLANARLISAAPELLEACKALLDIAPFAGDSHAHAIHRQAEAAIAKAEGRPVDAPAAP